MVAQYSTDLKVGHLLLGCPSSELVTRHTLVQMSCNASLETNDPDAISMYRSLSKDPVSVLNSLVI